MVSTHIRGAVMAQDRLVGSEFVPTRRRTVFLDVARSLAALSVVYTHIYEVFIRAHMGAHTLPTDALDYALFVPLKLDEEQGIGNLAVPVFFLISGFVMTPLALRMNARTFAVHRLFRIYPVLLVVVAASAVMFANGISPLGSKPQDVTPYTVLTNATLWNFIDRPFGAWVGVAWTLAVEMLFYAVLMITLPLLRTRMWLAIAVQLELVLVLLITHRAFGDEYRGFVINMTFLLIPVMGQAIWAASTKRIPGWLAALYVTIAWLMFSWARELQVDPNYIPRPYPVALAVLLFLIGLLAEPHLRERRLWTALSERTYSIYLVHGAVAFPLMHLLYQRAPLWLTVLTALAGTLVATELTYRLIERPTHNLARRLSGRPTIAPSGKREEPSAAPGPAAREADQPTERTPAVARPSRPPTAEGTEKITPVARPTADSLGGQHRPPAGTDGPTGGGTAPGAPRRRESDAPQPGPEDLPRVARAHHRDEPAPNRTWTPTSPSAEPPDWLSARPVGTGRPAGSPADPAALGFGQPNGAVPAVPAPTDFGRPNGTPAQPAPPSFGQPNGTLPGEPTPTNFGRPNGAVPAVPTPTGFGRPNGTTAGPGPVRAAGIPGRPGGEAGGNGRPGTASGGNHPGAGAPAPRNGAGPGWPGVDDRNHPPAPPNGGGGPRPLPRPAGDAHPAPEHQRDGTTGTGRPTPDQPVASPAPGGRRRRADSSVHAAWFGAPPTGTRRDGASAPTGPAESGWPGEQDDPDRAGSGGGRHRSE